jgi:hypothetical protein
MTRTPTTGVTTLGHIRRKHLMHEAVVTTLGHISERWIDVRGQGRAKGNEPWHMVR